MADKREDKAPAKSKRDMVTDRLRSKYPDRQYADDEEMFGQINDDYDEYDNKLNGYKEREAKLTDLFNKDPRSAKFITDMARGNDPFVAMIKRIGVEGMTDLINDPEKQEAFAEANKEYVDNLAKEKQLEEEYNANLKESLALLEQIQQQRGLTDEQIDAAYDLIGKIANEVLMGKFTEESIDMALKALNYDSAVEAATAEGEVKGRNSKIEERLRKPDKGDGQPALAGANNTPKRRASEGSILDLAAQA